MTIPGILEAAHFFAGRALEPGDTAVDATVGNGYDTEFLAQQVDRTGRVFGFDVQSEALRTTRRRLAEATASARVTLIHAGHEDMTDHLPGAAHGTVGAVQFNLGYLPGSSSDCITRPHTTVAALDEALCLLRPGGIITVVLYTGHEGGEEEAAAVEAWATGRERDQVDVLSYSFMNRRNDPPRLMVVEKTGSEAT